MRVERGFAAVALTMMFAAPNPGFALDKVKMTMAAESSNYAPYINAIDQGYYKDEGLDIEVVKAGGGVATPALISGTVEFSTSSSSALSAILKGAQLKVITIEADRAPFQLWTTSADLDSFQKLKGKTVGVQTRGEMRQRSGAIDVMLHVIFARPGEFYRSAHGLRCLDGIGNEIVAASPSEPAAQEQRVDLHLVGS